MVNRNSRYSARSIGALSSGVGGGNNNCNGGCAQGKGDGTRTELLHRLQALDFSITDTVLYLDAYPNSKEALDYYHKLISEREALVGALSRYGYPITHFENAGADSWDWSDSPWPWQADAN